MFRQQSFSFKSKVLPIFSAELIKLSEVSWTSFGLDVVPEV